MSQAAKPDALHRSWRRQRRAGSSVPEHRSSRPSPKTRRWGGDEPEFDFLSGTDEVATKLDLAQAYIDMGDNDGARDILNEVLTEGMKCSVARPRKCWRLA
jgi:FimV-like protein